MTAAQVWPSQSLDKIERVQRQLSNVVDTWTTQGRLPSDIARELRDYLWLIDAAITNASAAVADIEEAMGRPTVSQALERVIARSAKR